MRRRDLLFLGGLIGAAYGLNWWLQRPSFEFHDMATPDGFRRVSLGAVSGTGSVLVGLDVPDPALTTRVRALDDICGTLFYKTARNTVPVAMFTDVQCPYCRVLEPELQAFEDGGDITISWHDPALLGPTSEAAARAIIAARNQGAEKAMRRRITRGRFVPTPGFMRSVAAELGLNAEQLIADQTTVETDDAILTAKALAQIFGIPGTPALVIGRTLVIGNISPRQIGELVRIERQDQAFWCMS